MAQPIASVEAASKVQLTRWILDTRALWPGKAIKESASDYMRHLSEAEKESVLKKYHAADARMTLGSALLKRAYIKECTGLDWQDVKFSRKLDNTHGKPCWIPPTGSSKSWPYVEFNVSHQNGIVALVGVCIPSGMSGKTQSQGLSSEAEIEISVDIVSPNERNDMGTIASSDFAQFVSTFEYVFSDSEIFNLTYKLPETGSLTLFSGEKIPNTSLGRADRVISLGSSLFIDEPSSNNVNQTNSKKIEVPSELIIESKLRNFYAAFSLKEAYFKLGGEGIAAEWIKECEFNNVRAPDKGGVPRCSLDGTWGERIVHDSRQKSQKQSLQSPDEGDGFEMVLRGGKIRDVLVELQGFEEDFIICTMLRTKGQMFDDIQDFPKWQRIDLEKDLYPYAVGS